MDIADAYADLVCPLPVLRFGYLDDDDDTGAVTIDHCGEQLFVNYTDCRYLCAGGEVDSCGPTWEVVCGNGHTLVMPDHQGDDNFSKIPFSPRLVQEALIGLGVVVKGGGPIDLQPMEQAK